MNEEIFSQYLKRGKEVEIKTPEGNTEKIWLKPLGMKDVPLIYKIAKVFQGSDGKDESQLVENMTPEVIADILTLVKITLQLSLPELSEDIIDEMSIYHMMELLPEIVTLNIGGATNDRNVIVKQKLDQIRNANKGTEQATS